MTRISLPPPKTLRGDYLKAVRSLDRMLLAAAFGRTIFALWRHRVELPEQQPDLARGSLRECFIEPTCDDGGLVPVPRFTCITIYWTNLGPQTTGPPRPILAAVAMKRRLKRR